MIKYVLRSKCAVEKLYNLSNGCMETVCETWIRAHVSTSAARQSRSRKLDLGGQMIITQSGCIR